MTIVNTPLRREAVEPEARKKFTRQQINAAHADQNGCCAWCGHPMSLFIADHVLPLELGGPTALRNLQLLCLECNATKTIDDVKRIAKARRLRKREAGEHTPTKRPLRSRGFDKRLSKGFDGKVRVR